jgi:hypothetical protein
MFDWPERIYTFTGFVASPGLASGAGNWAGMSFAEAVKAAPASRQTERVDRVLFLMFILIAVVVLSQEEVK